MQSDIPCIHTISGKQTTLSDGVAKGSYILANGLQAVRLYGNNPFVKKQAKAHKLDAYGLFKYQFFFLVH